MSSIKYKVYLFLSLLIFTYFIGISHTLICDLSFCMYECMYVYHMRVWCLEVRREHHIPWN